MKYVLLLRGINVGGKNKINMDELKLLLSKLGFSNVITYINSGNIIFDSNYDIIQIRKLIEQMLSYKYEFKILFALIKVDDYLDTMNNLPKWWHMDLFRKDVLFFTEDKMKDDVIKRIDKMPLHNEFVHYSNIAVFCGKIDKNEYSKTAYHKHLIKEDFYKKVTIRNENTVNKILLLLK